MTNDKSQRLGRNPFQKGGASSSGHGHGAGAGARAPKTAAKSAAKSSRTATATKRVAAAGAKAGRPRRRRDSEGVLETLLAAVRGLVEQWLAQMSAAVRRCWAHGTP